MKDKNYSISSGNIFADLGLSNPEERLAKAELAYQINYLIKQRKLTQIAAAKLLGVDQPKISALNSGKLTGFSLERLFSFLNILGQTVTIKIAKTKTKSKPGICVSLPKQTLLLSVVKPKKIVKSISAGAKIKSKIRK